MLSTDAAHVTIARGRAVRVNALIFFVFALSAATVLSRLLISAVGINSKIDHEIKPTLASINADVALVLPIMNQTVTISGKIARQTAPLHNDLSAIVDSTTGINASAATIAQHVLAAEGSLDTINKTLPTIHTGLAGVNNAVLSIDSQTGTIATTMGSAAASVHSILVSAQSSNQYLANVTSLLVPLSSDLVAISRTLQNVNEHVISTLNSPILGLGNHAKGGGS